MTHDPRARRVLLYLCLLTLTSIAQGQQPLDREVRGLLDDFLDKPSHSRAAPQITRLKKMGKAAVAPLAAILRDARGVDAIRRSWAAYMLRRVGRREAVPHLIAALRDPSWRVRKNAANSLGALGAPVAIAELLPLLEDPIRTVRLSAGGAINKLASPEFLPHLIEAYGKSRDAHARARLVSLVGQIDTPRSTAMLERSLRDASPRCRADGAYYLASRAPERLRPHVERLLGDAHARVRRMILRMLPMLGGELPSATVLRLLQDEEVSVRREAASALGFIQDARVQTALMVALTTEQDEQTRLALSSALGRSRPLSAFAELAGMLADRQLPESLRLQALYALSRLPLRPTVDTLIAVLDARSVKMREAAAELLRAVTGQDLAQVAPTERRRRMLRWWRPRREAFVFSRRAGQSLAPGRMRRWRSRRYDLRTDVDALLAERILLTMELMHAVYNRLYTPPRPLAACTPELLRALGAVGTLSSAGARFSMPDGRLVLHAWRGQGRSVTFPGGRRVLLAADGTRTVRFPWGRQATRRPLPSSTRRTRIQLFWRRHGYREYARVTDPKWPFLQDAGGYFSPTRQEIVTYAKPSRSSVLNTLVHEAQHQVLAEHIRHAPVWLNEGLSEYYEQSRLEGGRLIHGVHEAHLRYVARLLEEKSHVPLRVLTGLDYNAFHNDSFGPAEIGHYAQAWSLVYFLLEAEGGRYRRLFRQYFGALRDGASSRRALAYYLKAHGLDWPALEERWAAFFRALAHKQAASTPRPPAGK